MEVGAALVPPPEITSATDPPLDPNRQSADLLTRILSWIGQHTLKAKLPEPWAVLGTTNSIRQLRGEPRDLMASLQTEFSEEQLLGARVIERSCDGQLGLSPVFGDAEASFVIRRDAARTAIDVISSRGLLSSAAPDWLQMAAEQAKQTSDFEQPILFAFSDGDVSVLHRLKCKCASGAELEQLSGDHVRKLFAGRAQHRRQRKYNLTIPGWQIAECVYRPAAKIVDALKHIAEIPWHFHYDPAAAFDVWMPSKEEFRTIRSALRFRDRSVVREACSNSLANSRVSPAAALRLICDRTAIDYGTARRYLSREVRDSRFAPRCGETGAALGQLRRAYGTSVINPLLAAGAANNDVWDRMRMLMGADIAHAWFESLDDVAAAQRIIAGEYPHGRDDNERLETRLRIVDKFAKLYALGLRR